MKEIKIDNVALSLSRENGGVRIKSNTDDVILPNQNIDTVSELIENNFKVVNNHYKIIAEKSGEVPDYSDVNSISMSIVLHYLYMYNLWRSIYKKHENRSLSFNEKDFSNPSTHDIIFSYFKVKYPNDWEKKCAILLGMELSELKAYYKERELFYNK